MASGLFVVIVQVCDSKVLSMPGNTASLLLENLTMAMSATRVFALTVLLLWTAAVGTCRGADVWDPYHFLLGEWKGEGGGEPGQGSGGFSFAMDLQGKVLVLKNHVDFPAQAGRQAFAHDNLMVVYPAEGRGQTKAVYWDSEGHVIHYSGKVSEDGKVIMFLSDPGPSGPRFRLSYTKEDEGLIKTKFEMAPPGKPDGFTTYVEGKARRQTGPNADKASK
jgi:hypothetical protein